MAYWNYHVIRKPHESGDVTFQLHEVYYSKAGIIEGWTEEAVKPLGESVGELREDIKLFLSAFRKPVLEERLEDGKPVLRDAYKEPNIEINDGYYFFEVMDRASVALEHCVEFLGSHPAVRKNEALRARFAEVEQTLYKFYQEASGLVFERSDS